MALITVAAIIALISAACIQEGTAGLECEDGGEQWKEYRLFLGRNVGDIEVVSDADWDAFLADIVTPRFPDGLSALDVAGQWRGEDGNIERERSKMLLILAPPDTSPLDQLNEVSAEYKRRFSQDAVLRVVTEACVAFK
ncbi:hypothetical protein GBAR_LOCUS17244 [Geodia barretti]|uniref:DUF3574 domain-containing protein n=1 Tax=Geodia barretti TaxID=519541 RepID=A0AA35SJQ6_GEOBA|nr:hypothetical protein GBAR_LOCUS17244 [Geodia barretti]